MPMYLKLISPAVRASNSISALTSEVLEPTPLIQPETRTGSKIQLPQRYKSSNIYII